MNNETVTKKQELRDWWVFTLNPDNTKDNISVVKVYGTKSEAKEKMTSKFNKFNNQFSLKEWGNWLRIKPIEIEEPKVLDKIK